MRVLIVHNRYRAQGGEERAVGDLASLLARRGHTVEVLDRASEGVGRGMAAAGLLAGGLAPEAVAAAVRRLRAEVVHAHNVHPLFGWRALAAAREAGARTVLHVHNFRISCAIGVAYRDGEVCFDCRGRNTVPGVLHRCRGSLPEAVTYGAGLALQHSRLLSYADVVIALSEAHRERLLQLDVPARQLSVLSNFVPDQMFAAASRAGAGRFALVSGRLVPEKGFGTAVAAASAAQVPLVVAGAGPEESRLRALAAGADVRFTGWLPADELARLRSEAGVVLAPSRWEEVCPYALLDALAAGVPVLVSDRGGLAELAGERTGLDASDVAEWARVLRELWANPDLRQRRGELALAHARQRFAEERYLEQLLAVYEPSAPQ
jgi:glycosyltransferase involved in cell wall biosynthesis